MKIESKAIGQSHLLVTCIAVCSTFTGILAEYVYKTPQDALNVLKRYGHYKNDAENTILGSAIFSDSNWRQALFSYQYMSGLTLTGVLDEETLEMMNRPRCAVKDNVGFGSFSRRRKRYVAEGSKWNTNSLTYSFINYSERLPRQTIRNIVVKAFSLWAGSSTLSFSEVSFNAHIRLKYAAGWHGDAFPFDGRGGVLAHAYYPDSGGEAHFDEDEYWTDGSSSGTNLLRVTTHEIGHTLGLGHSNIPGAVMAASYGGYDPQLALNQDDVNGIRFLYPTSASGEITTLRQTPTVERRTTPIRPDPNPGGNVMTTTTTTTTKLTTTTTTTATTTVLRITPPRQLPTVPDVCKGAIIDAIVVSDGTTFAFLGDLYYIFDDNGVRAGYPRRIDETWPQVGGNIDAALFSDPIRNSNGQVDPGYLYLFKGSLFWKFTSNNQLLAYYPRSISDGFPGIPNNIDASFIWSGSGETFFVKDGQYYLYIRGQGVDPRYPKPMSQWRGIPSNINSAFRWTNGRTYFFSGDRYYRFNDISSMVDSGYPRSTSEWWFGCNPSGFRMYPYNIRMSEHDEGLAGINGSAAEKLQMEKDEGPDQFLEVGLGGMNPSLRNSANAGLMILLLLAALSHLVRGSR